MKGQFSCFLCLCVCVLFVSLPTAKAGPWEDLQQVSREMMGDLSRPQQRLEQICASIPATATAGAFARIKLAELLFSGGGMHDIRIGEMLDEVLAQESQIKSNTLPNESREILFWANYWQARVWERRHYYESAIDAATATICITNSYEGISGGGKVTAKAELQLVIANAHLWGDHDFAAAATAADRARQIISSARLKAPNSNHQKILGGAHLLSAWAHLEMGTQIANRDPQSMDAFVQWKLATTESANCAAVNHPDSRELAQLLMIKASRRLGSAEDADAALKRLITANPQTSLKTEAINETAMAWEAAGQTEKAIELYAQAEGHGERGAEARNNLRRLLANSPKSSVHQPPTLKRLLMTSENTAEAIAAVRPNDRATTGWTEYYDQVEAASDVLGPIEYLTEHVRAIRALIYYGPGMNKLADGRASAQSLTALAITPEQKSFGWMMRLTFDSWRNVATLENTIAEASAALVADQRQLAYVLGEAAVWTYIVQPQAAIKLLTTAITIEAASEWDRRRNLLYLAKAANQTKLPELEIDTLNKLAQMPAAKAGNGDDYTAEGWLTLAAIHFRANDAEIAVGKQLCRRIIDNTEGMTGYRGRAYQLLGSHLLLQKQWSELIHLTKDGQQKLTSASDKQFTERLRVFQQTAEKSLAYDHRGASK